jgi:hypothetical protein
MKKVLLFVLVLFLAVPALSFAGSATSRWDLTIGGFVKVDAGYTNQAAGPAPAGLEEYFADRDNAYGNQNASNKGGSFGMAAGQTSLNFLVKGPDTWGAKTTAFIQGNFVGQTNNSGYAGTRYGTFTLSHAYMDFTWATTKLMVGYNWQSWGFLPSYNFLGLYDLLIAGRGNTVPQITLTQQMGKSFYGTFGIQEPYNMRDQIGGSANLGQAVYPTTSGTFGAATAGQNTGVRVTSEIPDVVAELGYKSDACGRIGPNVLQFGVGGMLGQDKVIFTDPSNTRTYSTNNVPRWAAAFKAFLPIIPERNLNKAGALSVSGSVWTGQNLSNFFLGARAIASPTPYNEASNAATSVARNYGVPVTTGGWGQISFYFTDKVYFNGLYGYLRNNVSSYYGNLFPNQIKQNTQYIGNILYDVNPAVRVGLEYTYIRTGFDGFGLNNGGNAAPANGQLTGYTTVGTLLGTSGSVQCARIAFWYFF